LDEALTYFEANPHAAWLRRVFEVARIEYGRVDYGVSGGVPQVWEINLTPTLGHAGGRSRHAGLPSDLKRRREESRQMFHERLMSAFLALDERGGDDRARATIEASPEAAGARVAEGAVPSPDPRPPRSCVLFAVFAPLS
jgi:hypothetical protein